MKKLLALTAVALIGPSSAYTLHEWGTFTSVSGSDGVLLAGLNREEELLPRFVHAHDGMMNTGPMGYGGKGFFVHRPLKKVTIKMETPIIYFYSDEPFKASVEVGFNGGSINQWYPQRSGGETVPKIVKPNPVPTDAQFKDAGGIDFSTSFNGQIKWDVDVLAPDASRGLSFKNGETLNWLRPRNSKANVLKIGEEYEDYLFYRGVGNFELPVTFRVDPFETLHIENTGKEALPFLFVQEVTPDRKIRFHSFSDGLPAGSSLSISEKDLHTTDAKWRRLVYDEMVQGLLSTGLTAEEAHGMVQTWWHSYFEQPGLRVFWVVPIDKTNEILPLTVSPAPEKTVRVLVGRSEVLRPRFEQQLVEAYKVRKEKKKSAAWASNMFHRYGLAFQERVQTLSGEKIAKK
ncbi:hypothetical protein N8Z81_00235 [Akkermansiaceae bacterium]|nr:hypothetical protein [Akkermansiaceae bacterium]